MPVSILLKALGYDTSVILDTYYKREQIQIEGRKLSRTFDPDTLPGQKASRDVKTPKGDVVVRKGKKFTKANIARLKEAGTKEIPVEPEDLLDRAWPEEITDPETGELLVGANEKFGEEKLELLRRHGIERFDILYIDANITGTAVRETRLQEKLPAIPENILRETSYPEKIAIEMVELRAPGARRRGRRRHRRLVLEDRPALAAVPRRGALERPEHLPPARGGKGHGVLLQADVRRGAQASEGPQGRPQDRAGLPPDLQDRLRRRSAGPGRPRFLRLAPGDLPPDPAG